MNDKNIDAVKIELFIKYQDDMGVYEISSGNRFGDMVVSIHCVTEKDRERISSNYPNPYKDVLLHFTSPIWGIGGLIPEKYKEIEELREIREYNVYGSKENKILRKMQDDIIAEENALWNSWSDSAKNEFLSFWVKKQRERIPSYGNCADKFLLD